MAAQKGKDLLIKMHRRHGFVRPSRGLRCAAASRSMRRPSTSRMRRSAGRWRELLDGAGIKRAGVSGRGLFKDAATDALMRQTFFDGAVKNCQVVIPDFGTVAGRVPDHVAGIRRRARWRSHLRPGAGIGGRAELRGGVRVAPGAARGGPGGAGGEG